MEGAVWLGIEVYFGLVSPWKQASATEKFTELEEFPQFGKHFQVSQQMRKSWFQKI